MAYEEVWGSLRYLADEPETDEEEVDNDESEEEETDDEEEDADVSRLCGSQETDPLQTLLQRTWDAIQKGTITLLVLLSLAGFACADSLTESQIAGQLELGVIPLAVGVSDELALNLLNAQQVNISYTANEPTSLQLSIDAVLKAIGIYVWPGGPTLITDQQSEPIVWAQSNIAIDTGASVSLSPTLIDFGDTPISTPEPSVLLLLFPLFGLMYYQTPNEKDVERAIDVLGLEGNDKDNVRNFYKRERTQNREANIKLLKAIGRVVLKVIVVSLIAWAFLATWQERLPQ